MNFYHSFIPSPVGTLCLIAHDKALCALLWGKDQADDPLFCKSQRLDRHPLLLQTKMELDEYFAGKRKKFSIPIDPSGTDFQQKVWRALRQIPYGETRSYGEQARMIGLPKASRAVGSANGKNPISIIVPCHRVIGTNGTLTGFGGGLKTKQALLAIEGIQISY
jgi:methylated-DNA-[protein]-cysteine S-methyltransferase